MIKRKLYCILSLVLFAIFVALPVGAENISSRYSIKKQPNLNLLVDSKLGKNRNFRDKLIVKFKKNTNKSIVDKFAKRHKLILVKKISYDTYVFQIDQAKLEKDLALLLNKKESKIKTYSEDNEIDEIDINEVRKLHFDKGLASSKIITRVHTNSKQDFLPQQWYLENDGINGLKKNADINAKEAWKKSQGLGALVAVIDTGFDLAHPDINYYNSGYDALNHVYNAAAPDFSEERHGTAVAGIICAKNNSVGVTGVAPQAKLIPIRMISDDGYVEVSDIIEAHYKAVEMGARIISNSWGSYDPELPEGGILELSDLEKKMYQDISENSHGGKGTLIIFSSGNTSSANFYNAPEARSPYTLSVGATDSTDQRVSFSNYGPELDLVAPGGGARGIYTTDRGDIRYKSKSKIKKQVLGYEKGEYTSNFSGTSASAPVVAGVAALVLGANPELSASQIKNILIQSANKSLHPRYGFDDKGWNREIGYGRVDAQKAVDMALIPSI
jgi:subtilisin family serine protease